jgi:hypothetical protein
MTEHNLFQEVQEDLERQKLEALWQKYGLWIIVLALGLVVSTASSTAYRSWKADHDQKLTSALLSATQDSLDPAKSIDLLQKFAEENAKERLASFALFREGVLALDRDDKAKAIEAFDKVAADTHAEAAFRQMGTLLSVRVQLDSGDPADLSARLQPLTEARAAWSFSAREALAYLALRTGDKGKAKQIFTELSQDARAPQSIRMRATDILRTLD